MDIAEQYSEWDPGLHQQHRESWDQDVGSQETHLPAGVQGTEEPAEQKSSKSKKKKAKADGSEEVKKKKRRSETEGLNPDEPNSGTKKKKKRKTPKSSDNTPDVTMTDDDLDYDIPFIQTLDESPSGSRADLLQVKPAQEDGGHTLRNMSDSQGAEVPGTDSALKPLQGTIELSGPPKVAAYQGGIMADTDDKSDQGVSYIQEKENYLIEGQDIDQPSGESSKSARALKQKKTKGSKKKKKDKTKGDPLASKSLENVFDISQQSTDDVGYLSKSFEDMTRDDNLDQMPTLSYTEMIGKMNQDPLDIFIPEDAMDPFNQGNTYPVESKPQDYVPEMQNDLKPHGEQIGIDSLDIPIPGLHIYEEDSSQMDSLDAFIPQYSMDSDDHQWGENTTQTASEALPANETKTKRRKKSKDTKHEETSHITDNPQVDHVWEDGILNEKKSKKKSKEKKKDKKQPNKSLAYSDNNDDPILSAPLGQESELHYADMNVEEYTPEDAMDPNNMQNAYPEESNPQDYAPERQDDIKGPSEQNSLDSLDVPIPGLDRYEEDSSQMDSLDAFIPLSLPAEGVKTKRKKKNKDVKHEETSHKADDTDVDKVLEDDIDRSLSKKKSKKKSKEKKKDKKEPDENTEDPSFTVPIGQESELRTVDMKADEYIPEDATDPFNQESTYPMDNIPQHNVLERQVDIIGPGEQDGVDSLDNPIPGLDKYEENSSQMDSLDAYLPPALPTEGTKTKRKGKSKDAKSEETSHLTNGTETSLVPENNADGTLDKKKAKKKSKDKKKDRQQPNEPPVNMDDIEDTALSAHISQEYELQHADMKTDENVLVTSDDQVMSPLGLTHTGQDQDSSAMMTVVADVHHPSDISGDTDMFLSESTDGVQLDGHEKSSTKTIHKRKKKKGKDDVAESSDHQNVAMARPDGEMPSENTGTEKQKKSKKKKEKGSLEGSLMSKSLGDLENAALEDVPMMTDENVVKPKKSKKKSKLHKEGRSELSKSLSYLDTPPETDQPVGLSVSSGDIHENIQQSIEETEPSMDTDGSLVYSGKDIATELMSSRPISAVSDITEPILSESTGEGQLEISDRSTIKATHKQKKKKRKDNLTESSDLQITSNVHMTMPDEEIQSADKGSKKQKKSKKKKEKGSLEGSLMSKSLGDLEDAALADVPMMTDENEVKPKKIKKKSELDRKGSSELSKSLSYLDTPPNGDQPMGLSVSSDIHENIQQSIEETEPSMDTDGSLVYSEKDISAELMSSRPISAVSDITEPILSESTGDGQLESSDRSTTKATHKQKKKKKKDNLTESSDHQIAANVAMPMPDEEIPSADKGTEKQKKSKKRKEKDSFERSLMSKSLDDLDNAALEDQPMIANGNEIKPKKTKKKSKLDRKGSSELSKSLSYLDTPPEGDQPMGLSFSSGDIHENNQPSIGETEPSMETDWSLVYSGKDIPGELMSSRPVSAVSDITEETLHRGISSPEPGKHKKQKKYKKKDQDQTSHTEDQPQESMDFNIPDGNDGWHLPPPEVSKKAAILEDKAALDLETMVISYLDGEPKASNMSQGITDDDFLETLHEPNGTSVEFSDHEGEPKFGKDINAEAQSTESNRLSEATSGEVTDPAQTATDVKKSKKRSQKSKKAKLNEASVTDGSTHGVIIDSIERFETTTDLGQCQNVENNAQPVIVESLFSQPNYEQETHAMSLKKKRKKAKKKEAAEEDLGDSASDLLSLDNELQGNNLTADHSEAQSLDLESTLGDEVVSIVTDQTCSSIHGSKDNLSSISTSQPQSEILVDESREKKKSKGSISKGKKERKEKSQSVEVSSEMRTPMPRLSDMVPFEMEESEHTPAYIGTPSLPEEQDAEVVKVVNTDIPNEQGNLEQNNNTWTDSPTLAPTTPQDIFASSEGTGAEAIDDVGTSIVDDAALARESFEEGLQEVTGAKERTKKRKTKDSKKSKSKKRKSKDSSPLDKTYESVDGENQQVSDGHVLDTSEVNKNIMDVEAYSVEQTGMQHDDAYPISQGVDEGPEVEGRYHGAHRDVEMGKMPVTDKDGESNIASTPSHNDIPPQKKKGKEHKLKKKSRAEEIRIGDNTEGHDSSFKILSDAESLGFSKSEESILATPQMERMNKKKKFKKKEKVNSKSEMPTISSEMPLNSSALPVISFDQEEVAPEQSPEIDESEVSLISLTPKEGQDDSITTKPKKKKKKKEKAIKEEVISDGHSPVEQTADTGLDADDNKHLEESHEPSANRMVQDSEMDQQIEDNTVGYPGIKYDTKEVAEGAGDLTLEDKLHKRSTKKQKKQKEAKKQKSRSSLKDAKATEKMQLNTVDETVDKMQLINVDGPVVSADLNEQANLQKDEGSTNQNSTEHTGQEIDQTLTMQPTGFKEHGSGLEEFSVNASSDLYGSKASIASHTDASAIQPEYATLDEYVPMRRHELTPTFGRSWDDKGDEERSRKNNSADDHAFEEGQDSNVYEYPEEVESSGFQCHTSMLQDNVQSNTDGIGSSAEEVKIREDVSALPERSTEVHGDDHRGSFHENSQQMPETNVQLPSKSESSKESLSKRLAIGISKLKEKISKMTNKKSKDDITDPEEFEVEAEPREDHDLDQEDDTEERLYVIRVKKAAYPPGWDYTDRRCTLETILEEKDASGENGNIYEDIDLYATGNQMQEYDRNLPKSFPQELEAVFLDSSDEDALYSEIDLQPSREFDNTATEPLSGQPTGDSLQKVQDISETCADSSGDDLYLEPVPVENMSINFVYGENIEESQSFDPNIESSTERKQTTMVQQQEQKEMESGLPPRENEDDASTATSTDVESTDENIPKEVHKYDPEAIKQYVTEIVDAAKLKHQEEQRNQDHIISKEVKHDQDDEDADIAEIRNEYEPYLQHSEDEVIHTERDIKPQNKIESDVTEKLVTDEEGSPQNEPDEEKDIHPCDQDDEDMSSDNTEETHSFERDPLAIPESEELNIGSNDQSLAVEDSTPFDVILGKEGTSIDEEDTESIQIGTPTDASSSLPANVSTPEVNIERKRLLDSSINVGDGKEEDGSSDEVQEIKELTILKVDDFDNQQLTSSEGSLSSDATEPFSTSKDISEEPTTSNKYLPRSHCKVVLLGDQGSGKTTLMAWLGLPCSNTTSKSLTACGDGEGGPCIVQLRGKNVTLHLQELSSKTLLDEVYQHQLISPQAIYLVLIDIASYDTDSVQEMLRRYYYLLKHRLMDPIIYLVATHTDRISRAGARARCGHLMNTLNDLENEDLKYTERLFRKVQEGIARNYFHGASIHNLTIDGLKISFRQLKEQLQRRPSIWPHVAQVNNIHGQGRDQLLHNIGLILEAKGTALPPQNVPATWIQMQRVLEEREVARPCVTHEEFVNLASEQGIAMADTDQVQKYFTCTGMAVCPSGSKDMHSQLVVHDIIKLNSLLRLLEAKHQHVREPVANQRRSEERGVILMSMLQSVFATSMEDLSICLELLQQCRVCSQTKTYKGSSSNNVIFPSLMKPIDHEETLWTNCPLEGEEEHHMILLIDTLQCPKILLQVLCAGIGAEIANIVRSGNSVIGETSYGKWPFKMDVSHGTQGLVIRLCIRLPSSIRQETTVALLNLVKVINKVMASEFPGMLTGQWYVVCGHCLALPVKLRVWSVDCFPADNILSDPMGVLQCRNCAPDEWLQVAQVFPVLTQQGVQSDPELHLPSHPDPEQHTEENILQQHDQPTEEKEKLPLPDETPSDDQFTEEKNNAQVPAEVPVDDTNRVVEVLAQTSHEDQPKVDEEASQILPEARCEDQPTEDIEKPQVFVEASNEDQPTEDSEKLQVLIEFSHEDRPTEKVESAEVLAEVGHGDQPKEDTERFKVPVVAPDEDQPVEEIEKVQDLSETPQQFAGNELTQGPDQLAVDQECEQGTSATWIFAQPTNLLDSGYTSFSRSTTEEIDDTVQNANLDNSLDDLSLSGKISSQSTDELINTQVDDEDPIQPSQSSMPIEEYRKEGNITLSLEVEPTPNTTEDEVNEEVDSNNGPKGTDVKDYIESIIQSAQDQVQQRLDEDKANVSIVEEQKPEHVQHQQRHLPGNDSDDDYHSADDDSDSPATPRNLSPTGQEREAIPTSVILRTSNKSSKALQLRINAKAVAPDANESIDSSEDGMSLILQDGPQSFDIVTTIHIEGDEAEEPLHCSECETQTEPTATTEDVDTQTDEDLVSYSSDSDTLVNLSDDEIDEEIFDEQIYVQTAYPNQQMVTEHLIYHSNIKSCEQSAQTDLDITEPKPYVLTQSNQTDLSITDPPPEVSAQCNQTDSSITEPAPKVSTQSNQTDDDITRPTPEVTVQENQTDPSMLVLDVSTQSNQTESSITDPPPDVSTQSNQTDRAITEPIPEVTEQSNQTDSDITQPIPYISTNSAQTDSAITAPVPELDTQSNQTDPFMTRLCLPVSTKGNQTDHIVTEPPPPVMQDTVDIAQTSSQGIQTEMGLEHSDQSEIILRSLPVTRENECQTDNSDQPLVQFSTDISTQVEAQQETQKIPASIQTEPVQKQNQTQVSNLDFVTMTRNQTQTDERLLYHDKSTTAHPSDNVSFFNVGSQIKPWDVVPQVDRGSQIHPENRDRYSQVHKENLVISVDSSNQTMKAISTDNKSQVQPYQLTLATDQGVQALTQQVDKSVEAQPQNNQHVQCQVATTDLLETQNAASQINKDIVNPTRTCKTQTRQPEVTDMDTQIQMWDLNRSNMVQTVKEDLMNSKVCEVQTEQAITHPTSNVGTNIKQADLTSSMTSSTQSDPWDAQAVCDIGVQLAASDVVTGSDTSSQTSLPWNVHQDTQVSRWDVVVQHDASVHTSDDARHQFTRDSITQVHPYNVVLSTDQLSQVDPHSVSSTVNQQSQVHPYNVIQSTHQQSQVTQNELSCLPTSEKSVQSPINSEDSTQTDEDPDSLLLHREQILLPDKTETTQTMPETWSSQTTTWLEDYQQHDRFNLSAESAESHTAEEKTVSQTKQDISFQHSCVTVIAVHHPVGNFGNGQDQPSYKDLQRLDAPSAESDSSNQESPRFKVTSNPIHLVPVKGKTLPKVPPKPRLPRWKGRRDNLNSAGPGSPSKTDSFLDDVTAFCVTGAPTDSATPGLPLQRRRRTRPPLE